MRPTLLRTAHNAYGRAVLALLDWRSRHRPVRGPGPHADDARDGLTDQFWSTKGAHAFVRLLSPGTRERILTDVYSYAPQLRDSTGQIDLRAITRADAMPHTVGAWIEKLPAYSTVSGPRLP